ncbi:septum site-determining protein MinC [Thermomonas hydrothermalis]|uniref:Probable septum site-determining protein MinC n=1 Tax=Thermomonas hydrothermalis TaxID=213588 RepID=A0A1M4S759_9GAMM|nr:septum site-determining protein MinC [Thermomonas hydrothermalis]MCL6619179.1 septum site-determining protein MinC [Thermomonas hydrothermalis]SHE28042.1 septum site-determining protein MinC [Thermomonas hydrothermalis]
MTLAAGYTQAGELKFGQVGIANLRIRELDVARLTQEMRERVQRAPKLFERAAVVLDFGELRQPPTVAQAQALLDGLRDAGVLPVALAYGTREIDALARALGLPLLAKFRAQYEPPAAADTAPTPAPPPEAPRPAAAPPAPRPDSRPGLIHTAPVRSGQQVYAEQCDLTVLGAVGAGAEVMADGSIHIYGALRGRALAGAQGNTDARIFCREFDAELVAVAGHYIVLEDIPAELHNKPVQIWLDNGQLRLAALG